MPSDEMEYDPEQGLWRPGRRTFLFMFGAAAVGTVLPSPELSSAEANAIANAMTEKTTFAGVEQMNKFWGELIAETYSRDRVFAPFERSISPFHRAMIADLDGEEWDDTPRLLPIRVRGAE